MSEDLFQLRPTKKCFDDSLDLIAALVNEHPDQLHKADYFLCHGICEAPDGHPYSHAWVESEEDDAVYNGQILKGKKIYAVFDRPWFYKSFKVREKTRYTILEAFRENERTLTYGPWKDEYLQLCSDYLERQKAGLKS